MSLQPPFAPFHSYTDLQLTMFNRCASLREKAKLIFRATKTHATNLAKFATIYKTVCYLLRQYGTTPGKEGKPIPIPHPLCDGAKSRAHYLRGH